MAGSPIIIIGAGISGLLLAQYLQKLGVPFEIFDRDANHESRSGGWGFTLHTSLPALRQLLPEQIMARLPETYVNREATERGEISNFRLLDLATGDILFDEPVGERVRVSRTRLRRLLLEGIQVQWKKTLHTFESTEESVAVRFEDGSSLRGKLLVACDGSHSRIRRILYPDYQANYIPVSFLGAAPQYTAEEIVGASKVDPLMFLGTHPGSNLFMFFSFLDTPNAHSDKYHCQCIISWSNEKNITIPESSPDRIRLWKSLGADFAEPFHSLVQNLPPNTEIRSINVEDWILQPGASLGRHPRVILVGDSAHTMTMYRGEGANNAILDVVDLVERADVRDIESSSSAALRASLLEYENAVFARAEPTLLRSRQACLTAHDYSKVINGESWIVCRKDDGARSLEL